MVNEVLSAELVKALDHNVIAKWIDMATAAVVTYEWFITFDMEVQYVWKSKWTLTKMMYLLNRYLVIADFVVNYFRSNGVRVPGPACKQLFQVTTTIYTFAIYMAEYTLALRVCVAWGMNKIIIAFLGVVYSASSIYVLVSFFHMLRPVNFVTYLPFGGCLARIESSTLWVDFVILLCYDVVVLGLMAYPTIKGYGSGYMQTDFVRHTYVEGVLFYVYLLVIDIVSVIVQLTVTDDIFFFVLSTRMLRSILAARVVLHLRENSDRKILAFRTNRHNGITAQTELNELRFN